MLLTDQGGGDFEQPPIGTHVARCVKLIDIGTQENTYEGKVTRKRQVIIGWELPNELMTEGEYAGKPFAVSRFYTASLGEKANLRKDLANWRGRDFTKEELAGFDIKNLLTKACLVSLTPNEKGRARVTSVIALPKGMGCPTQANPTFYLSLEPDEFDEKVFDSLSDRMKEMIRKSPEYAAIFDSSSKVPGSFDDMRDSALDTEEDPIPF